MPLLGWQDLGVLISEAGITHMRGMVGNTLLPWQHIQHITLYKQGTKVGWGNNKVQYIHVQLDSTFPEVLPSMGQRWMYRLNNAFMGTKHAYFLSAQGLPYII